MTDSIQNETVISTETTAPAQSNQLEEVLEKHFLEAYKREIDQDESVWRTLPFFAAAIGLTVTLILPAAGSIAPLHLSADEWLLLIKYLLFISAAAFLGVASFHLYLAMNIRLYRQIPDEVATLDYLRRKREDLLAISPDVDSAETASALFAREYLNEEMANATSHNRKNNIARVKYRSFSVKWIFFGWLALALFAALTFVSGDRPLVQ